MDHVGFWHLLHDEINESPIQQPRHIIRFHNPTEYARCIGQLKRLQPTLAKLVEVQDMKLIHGVSCNLHSVSHIIKAHSRHLYVEEDVVARVHESSPLTSFSNKRLPWGVRQIKAPAVWNKSTGSRIRVAVIDTGVDHQHPDLRHCLSKGVNLIQRRMLPHDDNGHGTHIAGTIAAAGQQHGLVGVAPRASIHAVKSFDKNGAAFISDIILGIDWCVRNGIDIINMSFGMKSRSDSLLQAVRGAYQAGVIIVASSGNEGKKLTMDYPARYPQTISVGAIGKDNRVAPFSNRSKKIDIYAPGEKIMSTWLRGKYHELSGTSMATSHVSGVIALLLSAKPGLKPDEIRKLLKKGSIPLREARIKGTGRIDAARLFRAMR
ncbi:peptidase S8 [Paenibacillus swuensis]|uniref:Peptidase S8 n=1 Tax=Paenibacillus swuensis TaxID=1178515 RepID=A0A172TFW7_9BACL|nr:S8 family peptidase [Paenibacillus swuensis]ANE45900.1 peptidase S8 [Paenibacillus swuensis]